MKYAFRAFTLIELLVVLSILSVLLIVAVPSFLSYRKSAVQTEFSAKVAQLIIAQRARAMSYNMTAYIDFDLSDHTITPKLAAKEPCQSNTGLPILSGTSNPLPVKIDIKNDPHYSDNGRPIVTFSFLRNNSPMSVSTVRLCYQPNGLMTLFRNGTWVRMVRSEKILLRVFRMVNGQPLNEVIDTQISIAGSPTSTAHVL